MKRPLLVLAAIYTSYGSHASPASHAATLRWTNGEAMPGDFLEATGATATWKTPLFEEPVILDWSAIHRVDWQPGPAQAADPFIITLRDGSALCGDVTAISGSSVFIHGERCGDVELKRPEVLGARRVKGAALLLAGPIGPAGWQATEVDQDGTLKKSESTTLPDFAEGPGGTMQIPYWNRGAVLEIALPDAVDVEFHLHAGGSPDFRLSIGDKVDTGIRIETWDDELVVACGDEFKLIRKIDKTEHDVALRVCWDRLKKHCQVFTTAGDLIADWQPSEDGWPALPGIVLQNKGRDLSLDFLRLRKWDGNPPPKIDLSQPRVEMDDGRILAGAVTSGSAGRLQCAGSSLALNEVDALIFSPDPPAPGAGEATLTYADGTYMQGRLSGIKDGAAAIAASFAAQPVHLKMDGLRRITTEFKGAPNPIPPSRLDRLTIAQSTYHGSFAALGDDSPRWLPLGAAAPVTPSRTLAYEIDRAFPDGAPLPSAAALFYTRAGDVLPGALRSLDRTGVEFDSGITETTKLPAAELEAIQFGASGRMDLHGFSDPSWSVLGTPLRAPRNGDSIDLDPGTMIGHPAAMQSSEIRFKLDTTGFSALRLRMFCAGADPAKSTRLLLAGINGQIHCGLEATDGQFDDPAYEANVPSGSVEVRLVIRPQAVDLYLNGACVEKFPAPADSRAGDGLILEPAAIWGNSARPVRIADFSTVSDPGCTWLPDVAPDAKAQALTVPRFRRDDPPAHALIAANGDILRGEIEAATAENFGFRTGLDELVVPRDRVKAVIWLGKPLDSPPPAVAKNPAYALLAQQLSGRIYFGGGNLSTYTSYLQSVAPDLKFQLPENAGTQNFELQFGEETVASALDRICALYGLTYRVDDTGVVVIEAASSRPDTMVDKVYWLKPGSIPADGSAAKILAGRGVAFPPGATASWQADGGQLRMLNTPENQAKLSQLLASDFDSVAGSPTHWLLLASGARLALAARKFGRDAITGWHPSYGRCTIPTADVAVIRSSPMEPSAAMKSVEDWRLVYAPEPVLPEAGGDSEASIGKPAAEFKLPLLGGGEFDLSSERGKVVVLDFWATWCGPCVHSLPGLIAAMSGFPTGRVKFIGVDQDEPADEVKQFLETRGWTLTAALDEGQRVGQLYGVDGIPHTVIIGPDGKVAWVKTGYTPDEEADVSKEVTQLLSAPH